MEKKKPLRMCISCRQMKEKKELVRVVKTADGVMVDLTGKLNGRGAYVCKDKECVEKLYKQRALNRAFSMEIDKETYESVAKAVLNGEQ